MKSALFAIVLAFSPLYPPTPTPHPVPDSIEGPNQCGDWPRV